MSFGSSTQKQSRGYGERQQFEPVYLKLAEGERLVRILDEEETSYWRYWIPVNVGGKRQGRSIVIGSMKESPIAQYMASLGEDHPEFRKIQKRMLLNVLDRTLVKKDSNGLETYADARNNFPATSNSGENISNVVPEPNNRVLVVEFGPDLMDKLAMLHLRIRDQKTFEPLPIWRFDVTIISTGQGKEVNRTVFPDTNQEPLPDELASLPKYDLKQLVRPAPYEFQQRLLDGEDYIDLIKEIGWERPKATIPQNV